jgi:hypothetical protein
LLINGGLAQAHSSGNLVSVPELLISMASVIKGRLEKNLFVTFFYALHKKEVLCK